MTRLAVLSAGPLGRIRGSGRAFPKARSLGVHALVARHGQLPQPELEAGAARLAAVLRPALSPTGEACFAALCTPQPLSDSALASLGAALEAEGIGLGLSVTRFALADRLARGDRQDAGRTLLLDAYGDGVALYASAGDANAVEGNLAETCEQRRGAVLRTFREIAKADLSATADSLDAWLDSIQSSGELESAANALWYLPDGTRIAVASDALERSLDEAQGDWIAAVIQGCAQKAAEGVDCLVVAGWLDALFHLGPRLRSALPQVRVLVLDYEREAEMIHTWLDARERPRAGRVWVVERDLTAAPAQLSWSSGGALEPPAEFEPEAEPAAVEPAPPVALPGTRGAEEEAAGAAQPPPPPAAVRRAPRTAGGAQGARSEPRSRASLVAALAVLAFGQIATISWIARSGRGGAEDGPPGRNDFLVGDGGDALGPVTDLRAELDQLRADVETEARERTAGRFELEELEAEVTKLRYALEERPTTADLRAVQDELGAVRGLAADAGEARSRLAETVAQLAFDVQDLQQSEMALAQLGRELEELRSGGVDPGAATSEPPADPARLADVESRLAELTASADELEAREADADQRLAFVEATLDELDVAGSLEMLTSTSHELMERVSRAEEALADNNGGGGLEPTAETATLLLDRCESIEQTLRNLRGDVERLETEIGAVAAAGDRAAAQPLPAAATVSADLVARIDANESAITAVRERLASALPGAGDPDLAPATLYPELAARRMRVFNPAGERVAYASYDEEGHGALRLYGADGSRQVLAGSSKGGEAGFLGTFDREGHELFMVTTQAENGAGHLSLMNGDGEGRISMTTDSDGDGVLWIRDRRGRAVEVLGGGRDLAETVRPAPGVELRPGQVVRIVGIDADGPLVAPSAEEYDPGVLGIVSRAGDLEPAMTFGRTGAPGEQAVALAGQVYCLVDAGPAAIRAGDLLVASGRRGHARRADPGRAAAGTVVGKALEDLAEGTTGLIRVWVQGR